MGRIATLATSSTPPEQERPRNSDGEEDATRRFWGCCGRTGRRMVASSDNEGDGDVLYCPVVTRNRYGRMMDPC